ncbi:MAG TPA: 3'-5' exonuclease [Phycisphaerae bacterium]|nr:exonuclease domain-containing protein [Phycisphaerales bacterium]HRX86175.1 3'-5' exonuclease [Phycisphaerae bacterium]
MARRLDEILVVDVESTCWDGPPPPGEMSEIIEIGLCRLDVATLERVEKRSLLIKPVASQVSAFCTNLTTITADMLDDAGTLADACELLTRHYRTRDRLWASWGDYDRRQFERVCTAQNVAYPFGTSHLNIKSLFATVHHLPREIGLDAACAHAGLPLEGTHHRGADDAWNIAAILATLLRAARAG